MAPTDSQMLICIISNHFAVLIVHLDHFFPAFMLTRVDSAVSTVRNAPKTPNLAQPECQTSNTWRKRILGSVKYCSVSVPILLSRFFWTSEFFATNLQQNKLRIFDLREMCAICHKRIPIQATNGTKGI